MGAATFVVIGALYALLVWCCFKVLQALVELLEKVANLFLMIGHGIADIIGKIKRHGVLVEQPNYAAFTDPATGRPIFCQVSRDAITAKVDVNKLQEQQQVSPPPQLAIPPGPSEECINLSPHYQMHVDELLSQRGFLLGTSGSGKSSTTAVIAEDLTDMGVPYVIFDTEGEYLRLPAHMGQGHTICNWT